MSTEDQPCPATRVISETGELGDEDWYICLLDAGHGGVHDWDSAEANASVSAAPMTPEDTQ